MIARLARAAQTLGNAFYESWFGISTRGLHGFTPGDWSKEEHTYYATVSYAAIFRILDSLALKRKDVVVDLGCGKGRVLCCASLYNVARVIGVEDKKELCEAAEHNLRRMQRRRVPWAVIHAKAEDFEFEEGSVFYMFHPFGPKTMKTILLRLGRSLHEKPRSIRIVYVNPKHEEVLGELDWLERYKQWPADVTSLRSVGYSVSFWRRRGADGRSAK